MFFVNICEKIDRVITAPHCIYVLRNEDHQWYACTVRRCYNAVNFLTNIGKIPHSSPVRVRYGVYFSGSSIWYIRPHLVYSASVPVISYVWSYNIVPRYNCPRLYVDLHTNDMYVCYPKMLPQIIQSIPKYNLWLEFPMCSYENDPHFQMRAKWVGPIDRHMLLTAVTSKTCEVFPFLNARNSVWLISHSADLLTIFRQFLVVFSEKLHLVTPDFTP